MTFVQQYLQKREIWRQQNKMLQVRWYCAVLLRRQNTLSDSLYFWQPGNKESVQDTHRHTSLEIRSGVYQLDNFSASDVKVLVDSLCTC